MKTFIRNTLAFAGGLALVLVADALISNDMKNNNAKGPGYIQRSSQKVADGILTPEVLLSFGRLGDPQLSPDGKKILYGVSYTSLNKNASCRNIIVCNTDGTHERHSSYGSSVSNARWSKDGKSIYFIQGGQLYKVAFLGNRFGRKTKLSDVPAGIGEFKISPDEKHIMYTSTVKNPLLRQPSDIYGDLDKAQAYETEDLMYRHWNHWVTEVPRTYVAPFGDGEINAGNSKDILEGEDRLYELPTEPFGGIEQLDWAPDSRHIAYSCRKLTGKEYAFSTNSCIFIYDIQTGETVSVTKDGGYDTDPVWSPDGTALAWISMERDGYEADRQRLMVAELDDCKVTGIKELTKDFIYDVAGICWTSCSQKILFPSTMDGIGAICRVNAREGEPVVTRLTPDDWNVSFGTPFHMQRESDGIVMLTTCQSMDFPTEITKVKYFDNGNAEYSFITAENKHILDQLDTVSTERIVIKTPQGEDLHCWVLYPAGFDPSAKYPVIEMFNGGPQTSLDQSWSYRWNFRMMCQQGYVVLLPNRHGDSGFGQAWKEQISGDYQGLNMEDYKLAARWAKEQPWCGKIAGVGASYGGFSVYNMMGIHGDLFDCFIAHAGIFNEKQLWYTTEEAWFGNWDNGGLKEYAYTPGETGPAGDGITFGGMQQAGAPYADVQKTSAHYAHDPESRIQNWHTPILCMHGMMDYRIPYEQCMAAFNAAQMMGVPSKMVIFPEENHWILQPQNALLWHREFFGWLEKWTKQ